MFTPSFDQINKKQITRMVENNYFSCKLFGFEFNIDLPIKI